jgi:hypothetical protein
MLAVSGTRLGSSPIPPPNARWIVLVEGPPDMISAAWSKMPVVAWLAIRVRSLR